MPTVKEYFRRIYHDFVRRRSTVRILHSDIHISGECDPIFIAGTYRSGTTLIRYILDSHSNICCPPESCFLQLLEPLISDENAIQGFGSMGFDEEHITQRISEFSSYFFLNYSASKGKSRWADKTPEYVNVLPFIKKLYPSGKYILIYRNGLDSAHSFTRGGTFMRHQLESYCRTGEDLRIGATRYWEQMTKKLLEFESKNRNDCFRIIYEDFCQKPELTIRSLLNFLDEPWEPQVLEYYEQDHDIGKEDGRVMVTRNISANSGYYRSWPKDLLKKCSDIALPTLDTLGYLTDGDFVVPLIDP